MYHQGILKNDTNFYGCKIAIYCLAASSRMSRSKSVFLSAIRSVIFKGFLVPGSQLIGTKA